MFRIITILTLTLSLTGCGTPKLPGGIGEVGGQRGIFRSDDGGKTFSSKIKIDDKNNIGQADVLKIEIDPGNRDNIYAGTVDSGVYRSDNAGESWKKISDAQRSYGIVVDPRDSKVVYITGILDGRGKIMKSTDSGETWTEIFAEPLGDFLFSSLGIDPKDPDSLYAGDSRGFIVKTENAGVEWKRIAELGSPIVDIVFDSGDTRNVYFSVHQAGLFKIDFGKVIKNHIGEVRTDSANRMVDGVPILSLAQQMKVKGGNASNTFILIADPLKPNTVYFGTGAGILKTEDGGNTWKEIPTLEGPGNIAIRGMAITGEDSRIIYVATQGTFYKSVDAGNTWNVMEFNTPYSIEVLRVAAGAPEVVYLGIRNLNNK